jgi:hypothetical protein
MDTILHEGKDFTMERKVNNYGFENEYPQINGIILERVSEPSKNEIVYYYNWKNENDKYLQLVMIKDGKYLSNGRVSNHWDWYELNESLKIIGEDFGYGCFYKPLEKFKVEVEFKINLCE